MPRPLGREGETALAVGDPDEKDEIGSRRSEVDSRRGGGRSRVPLTQKCRAGDRKMGEREKRVDEAS